MSTQMKLWARQILKALAPVPLLLGLNLNAQTTTPGVKVDVLGTGAESLLGKDLTDPEGDGLDELGAATDPSWNWKNITSSHEPDFQGGENSFNIFDNKVGGGNDKWCCDDPTPDAPVWVSVEFKQGVSLTHFTVTSGNDTPGRDPVNWAIQGSNDGTTFVDIYRFVDTTTPWGDTRNQVVKFTLPLPSPVYSHIRYIAFETPANLHQINEIEYFGTVGAPKPAIANGLKAYWNFDGNLKDTAGGAVKFDGTENGASPIAFVNGKPGFGKSMVLDGVDQFVEITGGEPDDLAFQGGSMTVAGWFKVGAFDKSWQALIAKGEGSNWRIHRRGGESGFAHAGGVGEGPAGGAVDDGNWHHFAAISDHTAANFGTRLYVDGVTYTEFASAANLSANGKRVMIGENPDARNRYWNGEVDDIAIWDRVLTEAEIGQLYAGGAGKSLNELLNVVVGDADRDGMPDTFEVENGFNPNDPSDAAKDFDKDGVSNLDEFKAGTNPSDVTAPTIVSVAATGDFRTVNITFSEEIDPASAVVLANYTITPNLAVSAATYRRKVVTLTTAAQTPGATKYTVAVKGVVDTSKNAVAAGTQAVFYSYLLSKEGVLRFAAWTGIGGNAVQALLDDPRYPATPDITAAVFSINSREVLPTDSLESYGAIMEGYITPAESGDYDFMLRSDDGSELFLSSDDKEANLASIAFESGCCEGFKEPGTGDETTASPIALVAGRKYFIRVIYKEGGGGDYGQVAWRKTTDRTPAGSLQPIPSRFLSSAVDLPLPPNGTFSTISPADKSKTAGPIPVVTVVHVDGKVPWTAANVSLKFDGVSVTPTIVKSATVATITYTPSAVLPAKSVHTVALTYPDPGGNPAVLEWSFEVANYTTLSTAIGTKPGSGKDAGFRIRTVQKETGRDNTDAAGERQLLDNFGEANIAEVGPNAGYFHHPGVINFNQDAPANVGNFNADNGNEDQPVPGLVSGNDNFAQEVLTYLDLPAGVITMGVNSDDGFNVKAVTKADSTVLPLGIFSGGRGASDSIFSFVVPVAGVYPMRMIWYEGGGGANAEWFTVNAAGDKILINSSTAGAIKAFRGRDETQKLPSEGGRLAITRNGANLNITFTGKLQSASTVNGPFADVPGATSPHAVTPADAARFYRSVE